MEEARLISWTSEETHVLLNPRLPAPERERLERLVRESPPLRGHFWMATSGTSGELKMVALSKKAMLASAEAVNHHLEVRSDDRWCNPLPEFHVGGLGIYARAFLSDTTVVALKRWDAREFSALCGQERVSLSSLVPAQVSDLVGGGHHAPRTLRAAVVGGGALNEALFRQARRLGWPVLPSYGMTECGSQIATASLSSRSGDLSHAPLELLGHLEARIAGEERLSFRGASLLTGYAVDRQGSPRFIDPKREGWFDSDDRGSVERFGDRTVVSVEGRRGDFLKIGGESVSLGRLQQILEEVAGKIDAALLAVSDERLGTVIHLAVAGDHDSASRIRGAYDERVLPFERARITCLVDFIPRSAIGKVLLDQLEGKVRGAQRA